MFSALSKRELVAVCEVLARDVAPDRLQAVLQAVKQHTAVASPCAAPAASSTDKSSRKSKKLRAAPQEMDFSKYPTQQVAFWVAYFGHEYLGLQCANPLDSAKDDGTVEHHFFQALRKVRLIPDTLPTAAAAAGVLESFSRCGRTDRGVSALGQVLALKVRSHLPGKPEIDYADVLNRSLPSNIMVLATAPIAADSTFNARFSCTGRTYRYFIRTNQPQQLDLVRMQQACDKFVGTHDFRNFCKVDLSNAREFVRRIDSCAVNSADGYVEIRGSGFLWHQIRLMMAVLFHVGCGLEDASIVDEMLDVDKCAGRPSFTMAEDLPLVLFASEYPAAGEEAGLAWQLSPKSLGRVVNSLERKLAKEEVQCSMTRMFLKTVRDAAAGGGVVDSLVDMDHEEICTQEKRNKHVKFMMRPQCKSVQERLQEEQHEAEARKAL